LGSWCPLTGRSSERAWLCHLRLSWTPCIMAPASALPERPRRASPPGGPSPCWRCPPAGSASSSTKSASLPGSTVPRSAFAPTAFRAFRVAAASASAVESPASRTRSRSFLVEIGQLPRPLVAAAKRIGPGNDHHAALVRQPRDLRRDGPESFAAVHHVDEERRFHDRPPPPHLRKEGVEAGVSNRPRKDSVVSFASVSYTAGGSSLATRGP